MTGENKEYFQNFKIYFAWLSNVFYLFSTSCTIIVSRRRRDYGFLYGSVTGLFLFPLPWNTGPDRWRKAKSCM
jgi:hypothetical protein